MENSKTDLNLSLDLWAEEFEGTIAAGGCTTNCAGSAGSAGTASTPLGCTSTAGSASTASTGC